MKVYEIRVTLISVTQNRDAWGSVTHCV